MPSLSEALQPFSAVLLTGGSSGIGKSFIRLVTKLKPELRICNLSRHTPDRNILSGAPENLNHFSCDVSRPADVTRAAGEVEAYLARHAPTGRVLLVNNSGSGSFGAFAELPLERIWRDARIERIWDGTSEVQRHIISRALLRPLGG